MANEVENRANNGDKARPIVVGVDGSESSRSALSWAASQAKLTGEPLVILSNWDYPTNYGYGIPWPQDVDFKGDARRVLEESIDKVLGTDRDPDITTVVIQGHAAPTLVEYSRAASLVVVGCRGHGEFAGMLLGSVSEFLTTHAHCPVVVVRGDNPAHG